MSHTMAIHYHPWGPELDEYSCSFEPRVSEPSTADVEKFWNDYQLVHVSVLESTLCNHDLNNTLIYGERPLPAMMLTLRKYINVNKQGVSGILLAPLRNHRNGDFLQILKHYYGFLCIRQILHIVCIAILQEMDALDALLGCLDHEAGSKKFTHVTAYITLRLLVDVTSKPGLTRDMFTSIFEGRALFPSVGGVTNEDILLLVRLLWEDRGSFFTLCIRGLLPGCTVFLYTIFHSLMVYTEGR
jgi:hypothetical protein